MLNKDVVDMDLYVGSQKIKLFGKERELKRLTNKEYMEMNLLDVKFQDEIDNIGRELRPQMPGGLKKKDEEKWLEDYAKKIPDLVQKMYAKDMPEVFQKREEQIKTFLKSVIPSLTDEELEGPTLNLFNAIRMEIEIRLNMDKYLTREESIQRLKEQDEARFRDVLVK
jgi:hypothetical protein